jgi:prepilin-type N-terminal cleavage/methylation domain-containing protein
MHKKNQGFTLIEISMVLVAIGLLVGAILAGQTLIRNARLLTINSQVESYKEAIALFKDKYKSLPGDMPNATSFWGADAACPTTAPNDIPKTATCDGNGDTFVGDSNGSIFGGAFRWHESYRFWQHLSNATLIDGSYTGAISRASTLGVAPGMNVPNSKVQGNGFTMLHVLPGPATGAYNANYRHVFVYGTPVSAQASTYNPGLTAAEALMLDQKVDDGSPGTGYVLSFTPDLAATKDCADTNIENTAEYKSLVEGTNCSLIFITGF